jgi:hypothetical protein
MKFLSSIVAFFKTDAAKKLTKLALEVLVLTAGKFGRELKKIATEEVAKAEAAGGPRKYELAYNGVKERLGQINLKEWIINMAIELCVGIMNLSR